MKRKYCLLVIMLILTSVAITLSMTALEYSPASIFFAHLGAGAILGWITGKVGYSF